MAIRSRMTAILVAGLTATALMAADRPPTQLHLVGDHWTAWDPPSTFPDGAKVYTIVRGDTLWDLAAKNLGNAYLWPQIWEKNQYVKDAHWIYPGDPLVLGVEVAPAEEVGATTAATGTSGEGGGEETGDEAYGTAPAGGKGNVPVPLGSESDIYCSGFVGELDETYGWTITGSEYESLTPTDKIGWRGKRGLFGQADTVKYKLTVGDIVYLNGGRGAGLSPGMLLQAVQTEREVRHPLTGKVFGRLYATTGRVRVLSVQDDSAIGEIVQSCDGILVGDHLRAFEPQPVPLARRTPLRPVNEPTRADLSNAPVVLTSPADLVSLGQDHVVYLDRGANDDVEPGDIYTIYRAAAGGRPPVVLGELAVLTTQAHSSVAKILESRYPIYAGDRLERK